MKKIILSIAAVVISASMFANKDVEASLCANTKEINQKELNYCKEITLSNDKYKVWSFKLGFAKQNQDGSKEYIEYNGVSNSIDENFLASIKTNKPEKLYLEEVIVVNENNEKFKLDNVIITIRK